jgi:hypothetical protein
VVFHDAATHRKPEARSVPFCGEKRLENFLEIFRGNAAAVVGNLHNGHDPLSINGALDGHLTPVIHRLKRIEQKVDENLFNLILVQKVSLMSSPTSS